MTKTQSTTIFDDRQRAVFHTTIMRLSVQESLAWLKGQLFEMSRPTYFRILKEINTIKDVKVLEIASRGLFEQHMERIMNLELALKLSWRNYHKLAVTDPFKSQRILDSIVMQQPLLSQYYEATKFVIKEEFPELINEFDRLKVKDPKVILKSLQLKQLGKTEDKKKK